MKKKKRTASLKHNLLVLIKKECNYWLEINYRFETVCVFLSYLINEELKGRRYFAD